MYKTRVSQLGGCFVALLLGYAPAGHASNWEIVPALSFIQHYTDNLFLEENALRSEDYVTEVNPAIAINADARRLDVNFNYVMQNLFYQNNNEYNDTNHLLQLDANSELVKDNLFFDVAGSIDQQIVSFDQSVPVDNVNIGNRTEVRALSMSPYLVTDMGGLMATDVRYLHGITKIEEGASDSVTDSVTVNLANGRQITRFTWNLSYNTINEERKDEAETIKFENGFANASYRLFNSVSLIANYGYANNDYQSTQPVNNGSYGAFGIGWSPNEKFSLEAVYGSEYRAASVKLDPTPRTSLSAGWRDTDIGLNPGKSWNGEFSLRIRRAEWIARYLEDTTTTQQIQVLPDSFDTTGGGNQNVDQNTTTLGFGVTNEVFVRKRGQLTLNLTRAKSVFTLGYFDETRNYQTSAVEQRLNGGNGSWNWAISGKTRFNILLNMEKRQAQTEETPDDFQFAEASMEWLLKRPFSASATYRYTSLDSDVATRSYQENRVILRLNAVFSRGERRADRTDSGA